MHTEQYIGRIFKIKNGIYAGFECTVKSIIPGPSVKISAGVLIAGKTIDMELMPEDLGIIIESALPELPECPPYITEKLIANFSKVSSKESIFNPGASLEEMNNFKSEIDIKLPDSFFIFYDKFNGTCNNQYILKDNFFLSLNEILQEKKSWDSFISDMRKMFNGKERGEHFYWFWNEGFVPFVKAPYSLFAVDTRGVKTGDINQVIEIGINDPGLMGAVIKYSSLEKYFQTLNMLLERDILFKGDLFSAQFEEIYKQINGPVQKKNILYPFDILPEFDWSRIYNL
jgi:hypothetical protein